jgi:hypothetical protein
LQVSALVGAKPFRSRLGFRQTYLFFAFCWGAPAYGASDAAGILAGTGEELKVLAEGTIGALKEPANRAITAAFVATLKSQKTPQSLLFLLDPIFSFAFFSPTF